MQAAAIVIMIFLIVVSVVVVSNTIKLTVFARAREISIMKYVGATNWFVRGPFLVEGIIIGIFSSLVSAGITYLIYSRIVATIGTKVMTILSSPLVPAGYLSLNLIVIFLAMGISIGACGSVISMRKFLDK
jgi:cell division transport system permease protein